MVFSCSDKEFLKVGMAKFLYNKEENFKFEDSGDIFMFRRDTKKWTKLDYTWHKKGKRYVVK